MGNRTRGSGLTGVLPLLFICGSFVFGGLLGCAFSAAVDSDTALQIKEYLTEYMFLAQSRQLVWSVPAVFWNQGRWLLLCVLFGLSVFGVAVLPTLFAARGFLFVFSIGCFLRFLGNVGMLPAVVLFGIPALLWAPGMLIAGTISLSSSFRVLRDKGSGVISLGGYGQAARKSLVLSFLLFVLCVCLECGLLPRLLPIVADILA